MRCCIVVLSMHICRDNLKTVPMQPFSRAPGQFVVALHCEHHRFETVVEEQVRLWDRLPTGLWEWAYFAEDRMDRKEFSLDFRIDRMRRQITMVPLRHSAQSANHNLARGFRGCVSLHRRPYEQDRRDVAGVPHALRLAPSFPVLCQCEPPKKVQWSLRIRRRIRCRRASSIFDHRADWSEWVATQSYREMQAQTDHE